MRHLPKIKIEYGFLFLVSFLYLIDRQNLLYQTLLALLLHEFGHLCAIYLLGYRAAYLQFGIYGAKIKIDSAKILPYGHEFWIAFAGPLCGFLSAGFFSVYGFTVFAGLNFCLSTFNILPILPLDGGRMLRALLCRFASVDAVDRCMRIVGICVGFCLISSVLILSFSAQCTVGMILFSAFWARSFFISEEASC